MRKQQTVSKIAKLKDNKKKEIEIEVKKAADRVDQEKSRLMDLQKDYKETLCYFNDKNEAGNLDAQNITLYYSFFSRINGKIDEQKKVHSRKKHELDILKNHLIDAHKEKKMFDILNEKEIKKEHKERADSEQKEADFFVLARRQR